MAKPWLRFSFVAALLVAVANPTLAQPPEAPREPSRWSQLEQQTQQLIDKTRKLGDWNEHYQYGQKAAASLFERYGFTSESDQFALEMMRAVESRPPWMIQERLDTAMNLLARRYGLDEDQKANMQDIFLREVTGMVSRHAGTMFEVAGEMLESRAEGRPFSAEQVARISEMARPMLQDGQDMLRRTAEELNEMMSPEQQERLSRDMDAAFHRMETIQKESYKWSAGKWSAEDWGLESDPIQSGEKAAKQAALADASGIDGSAPGPAKALEVPPVAPQPTDAPAQPGLDVSREAPSPAGEAQAPVPPRRAARPGEIDMHPWAVHVRETIAKYEMDDEQRQKAWLMYSEARAAAPESASLEAARNQKSKPAVKSGADHDAARKLERQFESLKRRIERLPTRAQRAKVAEKKSPTPARPAASAPAKP